MGELTVAILAHGLLGSALACATFAVGLGCVQTLRNGHVFAYPPGLLAVSIACFLVLVTPWLAPVSLLLVALPLSALLRDRARAAAAARGVAGPVAWSLPAALGLAL